ncbi:MAG: hypothetical protein PHH47_13385 [Gallionella sp.]|nr:hypothetical protein [Gallionella sp.]MDD4947158.1 hypothetical protein [Gallionella sp.]
MSKRFPLSLAALLLASCSNPPSTNELTAKYSAAPDAFENLKKMIVEDTVQKECFVVGLDNIGEYWLGGGEWTHRNDYETKLSLSEVLKSVGLTRERYGEYKVLFAKTGSERVRFCHASKFAPQRVMVLVYRAGLAVSGCSGEINWQQEAPPAPSGRHDEGDFSEITPLSNGWYLKYECT